MSDGAAMAKGLKFRIGKRKFRIWRNGMEIGNDSGGRVYFFWWHPIRWRK